MRGGRPSSSSPATRLAVGRCWLTVPEGRSSSTFPHPVIAVSPSNLAGGCSAYHRRARRVSKFPALVIPSHALRLPRITCCGGTIESLERHARLLPRFGTRDPVIRSQIIAVVVPSSPRGTSATARRPGLYALVSTTRRQPLCLNVTRGAAAVILCGALGLAGVLYSARYGTVNSQAGAATSWRRCCCGHRGVAIFGGSARCGAPRWAPTCCSDHRPCDLAGDFWRGGRRASSSARRA